MEIKIYNSLDRLYDDVAAEFADIINTKENPVLGLATGSSPIGVYQRLIQMYKDGELDFSNTTTFNLDEYCGLGKDDQQSYDYFMHDHLFNHINIKEENIHIKCFTLKCNGLSPEYRKFQLFFPQSVIFIV